jgi:hypothetical protein
MGVRGAGSGSEVMVKSEAKKSIGVDVYVDVRAEMLRNCLRIGGFKLLKLYFIQ